MSRAADVAAQVKWHGLHAAAPLLVTPGSEQVRATIERDGQMQALEDIGATVLANACGPCIGQWRRADAAARAPNTIVTSYNRNFPRRNDGQPTTMNFIASPGAGHGLRGRRPAVVQSADRHADRRRRDGVHAGAAAAGARGAGGRLRRADASPMSRRRRTARDVALAIDPHSERLQRLEPWPAWDGQDFLDMPVLVKTKGKTTTDHISPAGPWLRYRGHLDRFSDNMFMGATNAFTGDAGQRAQRADRRALISRSPPSPAPTRRAGVQLGGGRRRQLRRGQQPRARRAVAAAARRRGRDRPQLRAHP